MNRVTERALIAVIYMVSGAGFGAGAFWLLGKDLTSGAMIGGIAAVIWSRGKEFRNVWQAGLGFAAAGLVVFAAFVMLGLIVTLGKETMITLVFMVLPGWACGSLLATGILSRTSITEASQAGFFGAGVGILTGFASSDLLYTHSRQTCFSGVIFIFLVPLYTIAGGIAGYVLHRIAAKEAVSRASDPLVAFNKTLQLKINPLEEFEKYGDAGEEEVK